MASIVYANLDNDQVMKDFIKRCPSVVAMNVETKQRLMARIDLLGEKHNEILDFFKNVYIDINNRLGDDIIAGVEWA